jgi:cytidylate kinase
MEDGIAYGPCLLVSRECGSGGTRIARLAGARLGWQVFDREILDQIAQLAQVRKQLLGTVDENTRLAWDNGWQPELAPEDIGYEAYLRYLRQVVLTLGHHGDVVILGRGAQYLLPSRCSLRVRVVAPLEARIRRITQSDGLTAEEAHRYIQKFDADRTAFVRQSFQRDASSALNYDLVINMGEISLEAAVEMVVMALGHKLGIRPQKR